MNHQDLLGDTVTRYIYCVFVKEASDIKKFVGGIEAESVSSATSKICRKHKIPNKLIDREKEGSEVGIKYVRRSE